MDRALVAEIAIEQYGLDGARVSLLKQTFNTLFRIDDEHGNRFALRVGARERIHPPETETVETAWLRALQDETDIDVAPPIANQAGSFVTQVESPDVSDASAQPTCVLFEWVRGRRLGETMSIPYAEATGRLLARLHEHGSQFDGGRVQPILVGDRALGFVLRDLVPRNDPIHGTVLAEALDRAQAAIDALWKHPPHRPHILHGDLTPNNVLVWRHRLTAIDFQDALWGFEIQDVSMTMMAFEYYPESAALLAGCRAGYEQLRPWPAADAELLETLVAARHLSVLNLGYNLQRPGYEERVERHTAWLRAWMQRA